MPGLLVFAAMLFGAVYMAAIGLLSWSLGTAVQNNVPGSADIMCCIALIFPLAVPFFVMGRSRAQRVPTQNSSNETPETGYIIAHPNSTRPIPVDMTPVRHHARVTIVNGGVFNPGGQTIITDDPENMRIWEALGRAQDGEARTE
jgi:hypothetical protein